MTQAGECPTGEVPLEVGESSRPKPSPTVKKKDYFQLLSEDLLKDIFVGFLPHSEWSQCKLVSRWLYSLIASYSTHVFLKMQHPGCNNIEELHNIFSQRHRMRIVECTILSSNLCKALHSAGNTARYIVADCIQDSDFEFGFTHDLPDCSNVKAVYLRSALTGPWAVRRMQMWFTEVFPRLDELELGDGVECFSTLFECIRTCRPALRKLRCLGPVHVFEGRCIAGAIAAHRGSLEQLTINLSDNNPPAFTNRSLITQAVSTCLRIKDFRMEPKAGTAW